MKDPSMPICIFCNAPFHNYKPTMQEPEHQKGFQNCLTQDFGIPAIKLQGLFEDPSTYPICTKCDLITVELVELRRKKAEITERLMKTTTNLASIVVSNYDDHNSAPYETPSTSQICPKEVTDRKRIRELIFELWQGKFDEPKASFGNQNTCESKDENPVVSGTTPDLMLDKSMDPESIPSQSKTENTGIISREVARLKMKGKGDVLPISIEDEKEVEEVTCAVCNKVYRSKAYLSLHMRSHETGASRPHPCGYCDKSFFGSNALKKHLKTKHNRVFEEGNSASMEALIHGHVVHEMAKVTMQDGQEAQLIIRTRAETPSQPEFENQNEIECEQSDSNSFTYTRSKSGSSPDDTDCEYCGRNFATKVTLTKHIRTIHLKTIKVECPICKMTTRDHYNLSKHVLGHNPKLTKLTYNCPTCGEGFVIRRDFTAHYKRNHAGDASIEFPKPIIRALEESEPIKLTIQAQSKRRLSEFMENCLSKKFRGEVNSNIADSSAVSQTSEGATKSAANMSRSLDQCQAYISEDEALRMISPSPASSAENIEQNENFANDSTSAATGNPVIEPESSETSKRVTYPVIRKTKKRRRRQLLTYNTRTKLFRLRQELRAAENASSVKPHPTRGCSSAKLKFSAMTYKDSVECDNTLILELQERHDWLRNLNFNLSLTIDKVQTVQMSPRRDGNEGEFLLEMSPRAEEAKESTGAILPMFSKAKVYGPKSKLEQIRSRKFQSAENLGVPLQNKAKRLEILPGIEKHKTYPGPKSKTVGRTPGSPPQKNQNRVKRYIKTYAGPKSRVTQTKTLESQRLMGQNETEHKMGGKPKQPAMLATIDSWMVGQNKKSEGIRAQKEMPAVKTYSKPKYTLNTLKHCGGKKSKVPVVTLASSPYTGTTRMNYSSQAEISKSGITSRYSETPRERTTFSSLPKLQPAPQVLNSFSGGGYNVLEPSKAASASPISVFSWSKESAERSKYEQLAQTSHSFPIIPPPPLMSRYSICPENVKMLESSSQINSSGTLNAKPPSFELSESHEDGPKAVNIYARSHSLNGNKDSLQSDWGRKIVGPTQKQHHDSSVQRSILCRNLPQVEALLHNANIDISIIGKEAGFASSSTSSPKVPQGIKLIQVEDVLKGNTPTQDEIASPNLPPIPRRRFILTKPIDQFKTSARIPGVGTPGKTGGYSFPGVTLPTSSSNDSFTPIKIKSLASLTEPEPNVEKTQTYETSHHAENLAANTRLTSVSSYEFPPKSPLQIMVSQSQPPKLAHVVPREKCGNETMAIYSDLMRPMHLRPPRPPIRQFEHVMMSRFEPSSKVICVPSPPSSGFSGGSSINTARASPISKNALSKTSFNATL